MSIQERSFNWEELKTRLQQSQVAIDMHVCDRNRLESVYRERAARLAIRHVQADPSSIFGALVFTLGAERYAIELQFLAEVLPFRKCTPVPGAPHELAGVINLRGEVRPVLDVARLLAIPNIASSAPGFLVLLRKQGREVALKVDQVEQIRLFRSDEFVEPSQSGADRVARYLKAVTRDTVMLLSAEELLSLSFIKENS